MNESFYWKLEEAIEELRKRQLNEELIDKTNKELTGCPIPLGCYGFLVRHIATSRIEDILFEKRCINGGLKPFLLTYNADVFVTNNPSKTRLVRLYICSGRGRKGGLKIKRIDLVKDMGLINNIPLCKIKTKWGEFLSGFHERARIIAGLEGKIIEISDWLKSIGPARIYYKHLLAVCLVRGILFESFESPGFPTLDLFFKEVVKPSWIKVKEEFGYYPLIVKHPNTEDPEEERKILNYYPDFVMKAIPEEYRF